MATIGSVTKHEDGHYEGELKTLSVRADISIVPVTDKISHNQPDFGCSPAPSRSVQAGFALARCQGRSTCRCRSRLPSSARRRSMRTSAGPRVRQTRTSTP